MVGWVKSCPTCLSACLLHTGTIEMAESMLKVLAYLLSSFLLRVSVSNVLPPTLREPVTEGKSMPMKVRAGSTVERLFQFV